MTSNLTTSLSANSIADSSDSCAFWLFTREPFKASGLSAEYLKIGNSHFLTLKMFERD